MGTSLKTEQAATAAITLDEKDYAILRLLQQNAKLTVREIAASVHLSATPVHERIKRMEASGVVSLTVSECEPAVCSVTPLVNVWVPFSEPVKV